MSIPVYGNVYIQELHSAICSLLHALDLNDHPTQTAHRHCQNCDSCCGLQEKAKRKKNSRKLNGDQLVPLPVGVVEGEAIPTSISQLLQIEAGCSAHMNANQTGQNTSRAMGKTGLHITRIQLF